MIGGTVTEVILFPDRIWVNCEEDDSTSKCAIYVQRNQDSEQIRPADNLWWQGRFAMWTPYKNRGNSPSKPGYVKGRKQGKDFDVRIPKIGYSGVSKPNQVNHEIHPQ